MPAALALWLALCIPACASSAAPGRAASRLGRRTPAAAPARMLFGFGGPPPPQAAVTDRCFLDVIILSPNGREKYPVGRLEVGLFGEAAPACVARFKQLVSAQPPALRGVGFHRTLKDFIVQAGRLDGAAPFEPFAAESNGLVHQQGSLSMSQEEGVSTTEFFFVVAREAPECDGAYTVFGQVTGGYKEVLADINKRSGSPDGTPYCSYEISSCGLL